MPLDDPYSGTSTTAWGALFKGQEDLANLPSKLADIQAANARTDATRQETAFKAQEQPDVLAQLGQKTQIGALDLKTQQQNAETATRGYYQRRLADIAKSYGDIKTAKDADRLEAALQKEKADGNPMADQWIGRVTANTGTQLAALYGGGTTDSPLAAMNSAKSMAEGAPPGPPANALAIAQAPPAQFAKMSDMAHRYQDAFKEIDDADNFRDAAAAWDRHAAALDVPGMVGKYTPALYDQVKKEHMPEVKAAMDEEARRQVGTPGAAPATSLEKVGDRLVEVAKDPATGKSLAKVLVNSEGIWTLQGEGDDHKGIYQNNRTNEERPGDYVLNAKPGTAKEFASDHKMQQWLLVHPGDQEGALAHANGTRMMSPVELRIAGQRGAEKEASDAEAMTGTAIPPEQIDARAKAISAQYAAEQAAGSYGSPAPGAAAAAAPAPPTPAQEATMHRLRDAGAAKSKGGTPENPFTPHNQAQYDNLDHGVWYVDGYGKVVKKK